MLFKLDPKSRIVKKTQKLTLAEIGWLEKDLQQFLYKNLNLIFPDDELLLIMQSRNWQEEPDLMAIDKEGNLHIFELKAWESRDFNLLQVFRYGQIFGPNDYESLNNIFHKFNPTSGDLLKNINDKFSTNFSKEQINTSQNFIVITNGIDHKTRQSINYWSRQGLSIQSWIYRLHKIDNEVLIEFDKFKISNNPIEDINEGYYILNTNTKDGTEDDKDMITNGKAAAFFEPWKYKIEYFQKGDKVFLYRSGEGIVAMGIASGTVEKRAYRNLPEYQGEEYSQKLKDFVVLKKPITASEIKKIAGIEYVFMQTLFSIEAETGEKLWNIGRAETT